MSVALDQARAFLALASGYAEQSKRALVDKKMSESSLLLAMSRAHVHAAERLKATHASLSARVGDGAPNVQPIGKD